MVTQPLCVRVPKRTVLYVSYTQHTAHSTDTQTERDTVMRCDDAMLLEDKEQRGLPFAAANRI